MKQKTDYEQLLQDQRWQLKSLEIKRRDNFTCQKCGTNDQNKTYQAHHLKYSKDEKGKQLKPWEEPSENIITVCYDCHRLLHPRKVIDKEFTSIEQSCIAAFKEVDAMVNDGDSVRIPSGSNIINTVVNGGWHRKDLILIAGESGIGKSCFAINEALSAALKGFRVVFYSQQVDHLDFTQRALSNLSDILLPRIKAGKLQPVEMQQLYTKGVKVLGTLPIQIFDDPEITTEKIEEHLKLMEEADSRADFVIIDNLQLIRMESEFGLSRRQLISEKTAHLKNISKAFRIPVLILSHLYEPFGGKKRPDQTPEKSWLNEYVEAEQHCDTIIFISNPDNESLFETGNFVDYKLFKIAKHRNGKLDTVKLTAKLDVQKFVEYEGSVPMPDTVGKWRPVSSQMNRENQEDYF